MNYQKDTGQIYYSKYKNRNILQGGETKEMEHGKFVNILLKLHILSEGSYREDLRKVFKK